MDQIWHAAILDTQFYADLQAALGKLLHHRPSGASEHKDKQMRLDTMTALYAGFFSAEPLGYSSSSRQRLLPRDEPIQDPIYIFVRTQTGKTITVKTSGRETVGGLKERIYGLDGTPCDQQRMIFGGTQLEDFKTLEEYSILHDSTVHVVGRLKGC